MVPSSRYRVQCCTYNGHLAAGSDVSDPDLSSWLAPTLRLASVDKNLSPPDFIAVGFQELIPLHLSLVGLSATVLNMHDVKIKEEIEKHVSIQSGNETYTLLAKQVLGGTALLVYSRDSTVTQKVGDVRVAHAGTGVFRLMGNKGAVGVRITLDAGSGSLSAGGEEEGEVFTFVSAHLAAHDHQLQRRNEDWKAIVERLVFTSEGRSQHYRPSRMRHAVEKTKEAVVKVVGQEEGSQVYDTSYLFVFGDLNYRISTKTPRPLPLHLISHKIHNDLRSLLSHDQLSQERSANRTLHHLSEAPVTFPPTYKYILGTVSELKKFSSRVPGWCDRVLYATWADGEEKEEVKAKVEVYDSIMAFTQSDHKPVTAVVSLPSPSSSNVTPRLPHRPPFKIDASWRRKQLLGFLIDRTVGFFWCILMLAGFGQSARVGITTLGSAALAAWWYRAVLFGLYNGGL